MRSVDLPGEEVAELGPLLRRTSGVVIALWAPEQVYVSLWSHADGVAGHVHWVVQPVTRGHMDAFDGRHGVRLQLAMFQRGDQPNPGEVEGFAREARHLFR